MEKMKYRYMQRNYESIEDIFKDMYSLEMGLEFLSENIYPIYELDMGRYSKEMRIVVDKVHPIKFPLREYIEYRYKRDLEKYCREVKKK